MRACLKQLEGVQNVAFFDSSFHMTLEQKRYAYPVDPKIADSKGIRKYGFHGLSYAYIIKAVASFLKQVRLQYLRLLTYIRSTKHQSSRYISDPVLLHAQSKTENPSTQGYPPTYFLINNQHGPYPPRRSPWRNPLRKYRSLPHLSLYVLGRLPVPILNLQNAHHRS